MEKRRGEAFSKSATAHEKKHPRREVFHLAPMCGIAALVSSQLSPDSRREAAARIVARQHHRGPDDSGVLSEGDATIGMCRLAIIDPALGRQPMSTADGRFHLVFNGAIYNHRELRAELEAEGRVFRTHCDTEVLLEMLARHGSAALPRLRGMFAFSLWDSRERRLLAARDPFGIKPLYHAMLPGGGVIITSELNGMLASGLVQGEIDPAAVGEYLAWFCVPAPRTIYRGVYSLQPGCLLESAAGARPVVRTWWQIPSSTSPSPSRTANSAEFARGLRAQLEDSIRAHLVADVPVGALLSGGLDSTAMVALMTAASSRKMRTFSLVFDEADFSEREAAAEAARAFGTEHHEELLTGARVAADLPEIIRDLDQPTGDGINTYYACLAARRGGVKVAISGLGGDELFGGYPSFTTVPRIARLLPWWRRMPPPLRSAALQVLRSQGTVRALKLADFLTHARDLHEVASMQRRVLPEKSRLGLLTPEARAISARLGPNHPQLDDLSFVLAGADDFQVASAWEMRTYMADVLLRDSDVFSMANSIELRVPLVDRPLLEWLWPQPAAFKAPGGQSKQALREAVGDLLPPALLDRPKRGFALPFPVWMKSELAAFLDDVFSPSSLAACPWLEASSAAAHWKHFKSSHDTRAWSRVWTIAILIAFANRGRVQ